MRKSALTIIFIFPFIDFAWHIVTDYQRQSWSYVEISKSVNFVNGALYENRIFIFGILYSSEKGACRKSLFGLQYLSEKCLVQENRM